MTISNPKKWYAKSIINCLLLTGIIAYTVVIASNMGFDARMFFGAGDVFADFFKFISSYPGSNPISPEEWAPSLAQEKINNYISNNPYTTYPSINTNLWIPPTGTLFYLIIRWALGISPIITFVITFAAFLSIYTLLLKKCLGKFEANYFNSMSIAILTICTYPFIFLIMRGNIGALVAATAIFYSIEQLISKRSLTIKSMISFAIAVNTPFGNILRFSSVHQACESICLRKIQKDNNRDSHNCNH